MKLNGRPIRHEQLQAELAAAGIAVGALGTSGDDLFSYNAAGDTVDLPAAAAPVVAAHTPQPTAVEQADTADLGLYAPLLTQLAADRATLIDPGQTITLAQHRLILARVIRLELLLARLLRRRLGLDDANVPNT